MWEIADLYAELPSHVAAVGNSHGPKVSGSKAKPIPVRLDVIDLLGPVKLDAVHGDYRDQAGYLSVATVLASWAYDWRDTLFADQTINDVSVVGLVPWLRNRLDYACDQHEAIGDFAAELRSLIGALRRATGVSKELDTASVAQKLDGVKSAMFTGTAGDSVPKDRHDAMLSANEVALLVGVTKMTVSNWRKAGKLNAQLDDRGHAQYRLGDVLSLTRAK